MAELQEDFGMMASPEWYEEDITIADFELQGPVYLLAHQKLLLR